MKKLGLVGGTGPESTLVYYKEINRQIHMKTGGTAFPEISIESVNLYRALGYVADEKYGELSSYLSDAINNLVNGGAELVALTAGTMHVVYDEIKDRVHVPLVSIPDAVSEAAASHKFNKVGLLGTIFTMQNDFFKKAFTEKGIDVVTPSDEDMMLVNERISKELEYGIIKDSTREELVNIIMKMKNTQAIEAVVLGCTELPLILNSDNCPVECLDIMDIHIDKLVRLVMGS